MEPMGIPTCPAGPMSFPRHSPMECTPALLATPTHRPHLVSVSFAAQPSPRPPRPGGCRGESSGRIEELERPGRCPLTEPGLACSLGPFLSR